jgi:hypothetical protein
MNVLSLSSGLIMQFLRAISRLDVYVLLNIVASHYYLNAKHIGFHVKKDNDKVVLQNGLEVELEGSVMCLLQINKTNLKSHA